MRIGYLAPPATENQPCHWMQASSVDKIDQDSCAGREKFSHSITVHARLSSGSRKTAQHCMVVNRH